MQRDRERQTDRWLTFEKRVLGVPESPERGFELALYFAITGSQMQGMDAVKWALAHPCERRQVALVLDWVGAHMSEADRKTLLEKTCAAAGRKFEQMRDRLFWQIARHEAPIAEDATTTDIPPVSELYALVEYLDVYYSTQHEDLRRKDTVFYMQLPRTYLLSMPPQRGRTSELAAAYYCARAGDA